MSITFENGYNAAGRTTVTDGEKQEWWSTECTNGPAIIDGGWRLNGNLCTNVPAIISGEKQEWWSTGEFC